MSVNVKTTDGLQKIASNVSIAQADWNQRENTEKNTRILNQPETLTSMEEINANTNENALAGAMAVKEGMGALSNSLNEKTKYEHQTVNISNINTDNTKYKLMCFRIGNIKRITAAVPIDVTLEAGKTIQIATLPENFRPSTYGLRKVFLYRSYNDKPGIGEIHISASGDEAGIVKFYPYTVPSTGGTFYLDETFF